jgi:hypothetical protein
MRNTAWDDGAEKPIVDFCYMSIHRDFFPYIYAIEKAIGTS